MNSSKVNRRAILGGALATVVQPARATQVPNYETIEGSAKKLAEDMALVHGGEWKVMIDHSCKMIAICQTD